MHRNAQLATAGLLVAGAFLAWVLAGPDSAPPAASALPEAPAPVSASVPARAPAPPVASAPPVSAPAPEAPDTAEELSPEEAERLQLISQDARLRDRMQQQKLAAEADARWHEAVDEGQYAVEDLDPAVVYLFSNIDLEPRYAAGGYIEGLVIQSMVADHPLALSGFRSGDRIDEIQGVPLRDPRDIPSLLAHLGPNVEVCAQRDGARLCRQLELE